MILEHFCSQWQGRNQLIFSGEAKWL